MTIYDMQVLRIAERYHVLPDQVEQMDEYWFNRSLRLMTAEALAYKIDK